MKTYHRTKRIHQELVTLPKEYVGSCRLCLNNIPGSSSIDGVTKDKIKYCVGLEVRNCYGLPYKICDTCFKMVHNFYIFKKMCISSDVKLQELVEVSRKVNRKDGCTPQKNVGYVSTVSNEDISLIEDTVGLASFLLEEDNIHPDAPNEVIAQLKQKSADDAQRKSEINLNETSTRVKNEVIVQSKNRPVVLSRKSLKKHYPCGKCKQSFTQANNLIWHEKHAHNIERFHCHHCSQSFVNKALIECHMKKHTIVKPFRCNVCSKTFSQKTSMTRHFALLHCEKKYECKECPKKFTTLNGLNSHALSHTERDNELGHRYQCRFCTNSYRHCSGLSRHLAVHSGIISTCKMCQKSFVDPSCLRRHLVTVHNIGTGTATTSTKNTKTLVYGKSTSNDSTSLPAG